MCVYVYICKNVMCVCVCMYVCPKRTQSKK